MARRLGRLLPVLFLLWGATQAHAAEWTQLNWQSGAASLSTTSVLTGWTGYDSQDGNAVILSTGVQVVQNAARSWAQSDDGTGDSGFNRTGSMLSSTTVSGTGSGAFLHMVAGETVTIKATTLPEGRGNASAVYDPVSGDVFMLGGRVPAENKISSDVFRYNPVTGSLGTYRNILPWPRQGMASAYHPGMQKIVMLNGQSPSFSDSNMSQAWDPLLNQASDLFADAPGLSFAAAAYYPGDGKVYYFGGESGAPHTEIVAVDPSGAFTWETKSAALPVVRTHGSAAYCPKTGKIYILGGMDASKTSLAEIIEYDPVADSTRAMNSVLAVPRSSAAAVYFPPTGKILLFGGARAGVGALDDIVEFDPVADTITVRPVHLPSARGGLAAAYDERGQRVFLFGGSTGTAADFNQILEYRAISSGTYVSAVFDTGNRSNLDTLSWNPVTQSTGVVALGIGFRAGNTPVPNAGWTNAGKFATVNNGGSLAAFSPNRYVQYSATFTTTEVSTYAVLADITLAYTQTAASATLVSSAFDTGSSSSKLQKLSWQGTVPAGTTAQFQLRTASDAGNGFPATWSAWLGPSGAADFYRSPGGSDTINASHQDFLDDRWLQYRLVLGSTDTFNTPTVGTVTVQFVFLPSSPTLTSLTLDNATQFTAHWTDNAVNEDEFVFSTGTTSGPTNLGATAASTDKPGSGSAQSAPISGLLPNRRYYVRLRAHVSPPDDLYSPYSNELSSYTLAETPATPQASAVFLSSLTLSWNPGANPGTTPYEVSLSTDGFATSFSTPVPFSANLFAPTTTLTGLSPGTTYSLRVSAQNGDLVASVFSSIVTTPTAPAPLGGPAGTALGVSSISWTWSDSGPAARYRVYSASSAALLADVGATAFVEIAIATNAAAGLRVEPYTGTASAGLSPPATVYTQADPPAALSVDAALTTSIQLSWDGGVNPGGTRYEVSLSSDGFVAHFSTPVPLSSNLTAPTTTLTGLAAGTTHYFRVRSANADGVFSPYANVASTETLPGTLGAPTGVGLGISSISWTWTNTAGPSVAFYDVVRAADGVWLGSGTAAAFIQTGFSTNTAHGIRVSARNATGAGALSPPATAYTLAAAPSGLGVTAVYVSSIALSWNANQNPGATAFVVEDSTDGAAFASIATATAGAYTAPDLFGPATHYFRVRAFNGDGVPTAYAVGASTFIAGVPPLPPRDFAAASLVGARIQLTWNVSPTTTVVRYNLYWDNGTGTIDYGVSFSSVAGSSTSFLTPTLTPGAAYRFGLRAQDELGSEERNTGVTASASALAALTGVRAAIKSPSSGLKITGDRVTVMAELLLGSVEQVKSVRFQFKASSDTLWQDMPTATANHPNPDLDAPYFVHWDVSGFAAADYDLRAVAVDASDAADASPPGVTVTVAPAGYDLREFSIGGGRIQKDQRVYNSVDNALYAAEADANFLTKAFIPAGALNVSTVTLTLLNNPAGAPAATTNVRPAGLVSDITLGSGQTVLSAGKSALLTFTFPDKNGDGIVDGTLLRADSLGVYVYDAASARWRKEAASSMDPRSHTITAATPHFSVFGLFAASAADLGTVRVYPNPFKPNNEGSNDGTPYVPGDLNSGIIFDNLPDQATIKIYTVSAQLVRELSAANAAGRVQWDAKNAKGADVASGGYFAVITSPGLKSTVKKLGIIR